MSTEDELIERLSIALLDPELPAEPSAEELAGLAELVDITIVLPKELSVALGSDMEVEPSAEELAALGSLVATINTTSATTSDETAEVAGTNVVQFRRPRKLRRTQAFAAMTAAIVLSTSGVAAAATGNVPLPDPVQAVAYDLGLPVNSPQYDKAMAAVKQLRAAIARRDAEAAAKAAALLDKHAKGLDNKELGRIKKNAAPVFEQAKDAGLPLSSIALGYESDTSLLLVEPKVPVTSDPTTSTTPPASTEVTAAPSPTTTVPKTTTTVLQTTTTAPTSTTTSTTTTTTTTTTAPAPVASSWQADVHPMSTLYAPYGWAGLKSAVDGTTLKWHSRIEVNTGDLATYRYYISVPVDKDKDGKIDRVDYLYVCEVGSTATGTTTSWCEAGVTMPDGAVVGAAIARLKNSDGIEVSAGQFLPYS